jgi:hypothetical protein
MNFAAEEELYTVANGAVCRFALRQKMSVKREIPNSSEH